MYFFAGNSSSTEDRGEGVRSLDGDQAVVDTELQSTEGLASSVVTLSNSSQMSKGPSKSLTSDTGMRQSSSTNTSLPPTSQSGASSSDSRPSGSTLAAKNTSVNSDSATVLQHRSSAVTNSGKLSSTASSGFAGSSAPCVNEVISNSSEGITNVGPTVTSAEMNGNAHDRGSGTAIDTDRLSLIRPQTLAVGRQKSEDDMEHMQEVADNLVAKLMDDEEGQDKLLASGVEKWYYRDPQGEVQGGFYHV